MVATSPRVPACRRALSQVPATSRQDEDWVAQGADRLRAAPLIAGAVGIGGVLLNRVVSGVSRLSAALTARRSLCCSGAGRHRLGLLPHPPNFAPWSSAQIAPVVSAGSSQSRADVLVIFLSAVLVLTGLQWLSLKPKVPVQVELDGPEVEHLDGALSEKATAEIRW